MKKLYRVRTHLKAFITVEVEAPGKKAAKAIAKAAVFAASEEALGRVKDFALEMESVHQKEVTKILQETSPEHLTGQD